tara:strand:- start:172 stop:594 length:423 start_codon:yes stop_codon:yes gene_type:complete
MKTKTLTAHAKYQGVYTDPKDDGVVYITNFQNYQQSHFLIPSTLRWIYIPMNVQQDLINHTNFQTGKVKYFPKYRGVWDVCPYCHNERTCGSVFLDKTDIAVGHCIMEEQYTFSVLKEQEYIECNEIFFDFDERREDNDT